VPAAIQTSITHCATVAEAIDLEMLGGLLGPRGGTVERPFPRRTPQYVGFEHTPDRRTCRASIDQQGYNGYLLGQVLCIRRSRGSG
jgi:hypothetical protein